jgi:hypothetical protein
MPEAVSGGLEGVIVADNAMCYIDGQNDILPTPWWPRSGLWGLGIPNVMFSNRALTDDLKPMT